MDEIEITHVDSDNPHDDRLCDYCYPSLAPWEIASADYVIWKGGRRHRHICKGCHQDSGFPPPEQEE